MKKNDKKPIDAGGVDEYIATCPQDIRNNLEKVRAAIRDVAPGATETVSYFEIPGYSYNGYDYNGMFAWFSYKQPFIRLHVRPPVIEDHATELKDYKTTASIISFPAHDEIPTALIKVMTNASLAVMKNNSN